MAEREFQLRSKSFQHAEYIPRVHSREGEDRSPSLEWETPPDQTQSLVLRVVDPDAPNGPFTHWVLFDIPRDTTSLDEGTSPPGIEGRNDFEHPGWGGPMPPPKHGDHRYVFTLSALDVETLDLQEGARLDEVEQAMEGHVLDEAELMGRYRRD